MKRQWTLKHKFALGIHAKLRGGKCGNSWSFSLRQRGAHEIGQSWHRKHTQQGGKKQSQTAQQNNPNFHGDDEALRE